MISILLFSDLDLGHFGPSRGPAMTHFKMPCKLRRKEVVEELPFKGLKAEGWRMTKCIYRRRISTMRYVTISHKSLRCE